MQRNPSMAGDAYWICRLAPYGLVIASVVLGLSLIWVSPRFDYLGLAAVSGAAVAICHSVKWRTGLERYQLLAMAIGLVPFLIALRSLSTGQKTQYVAALLVVYAASLTLLARKIHEWISMNTEPTAAPNGGSATPLASGKAKEEPPSVS
jgi:hypothetical protein